MYELFLPRTTLHPSSTARNPENRFIENASLCLTSNSSDVPFPFAVDVKVPCLESWISCPSFAVDTVDSSDWASSIATDVLLKWWVAPVSNRNTTIGLVAFCLGLTFAEAAN